VTASSSKQQQAAASSSKQQQAAASSSKQQQAAASSSKQQQVPSSRNQQRARHLHHSRAPPYPATCTRCPKEQQPLPPNLHHFTRVQRIAQLNI